MVNNPLLDVNFWPALRNTGLLLVLGFGLVLFFARRSPGEGLHGELGQRYLSWMIIAPLFLLSIFVGGLVAIAVLTLFFFQVCREYVRVAGVERPYANYLYLLIPVTLFIAALTPDLFFALPAFTILTLTLIPLLTGRIENLYLQLSYAGRGYLYLIWSVAHLLLLGDLVNKGVIFSIGVAVALSDVMQYTIGKLIGRHIISPNVNPRKAWEGLIGDLIGAGLGVFLFSFAYPPEFGIPERLGLALLLGLGSAWGDLISSMIKRVAGSKDWGDLLPGHGGLLDRANSMVIAIPLAYYYIYFLERYGYIIQ